MKDLFFSLGLQYYIATRFSHFAELYPTTGNQGHHAIEMFLKGFLYDELDLEPDEILYKFKHTYRHNLRKLWREFKRFAPDPDMGF